MANPELLTDADVRLMQGLAQSVTGVGFGELSRDAPLIKAATADRGREGGRSSAASRPPERLARLTRGPA